MARRSDLPRVIIDRLTVPHFTLAPGRFVDIITAHPGEDAHKKKAAPKDG